MVDFGVRAKASLESLRSAESRPVWAMRPGELRRALTDLAEVESQLVGLRLELLAGAERTGACTETGARTAADWVAPQTRQRRPHARADLHLAQSLEHTHLQVKGALRAGQVKPAQARAIVRSLQGPLHDRRRGRQRRASPLGRVVPARPGPGP